MCPWCSNNVIALYVEAEKEDQGSAGLRKFGYSMDAGLIRRSWSRCWVVRAGFSLEIGCYQGNKAETLIIVPIVEQL